MDEPDENEMWEMLLATREKLAADARRLRREYAEFQEQKAHYRESSARMFAKLDELEALARRAYPDDDAALERSLADIAEMRKTEEDYGRALSNHEQPFADVLRSLADYEEGLNELEAELRAQRN